MLLGYSFEPRLNSRALGSGGSVMTIGFINKRMIAPGEGGSPDFKWQVWSNGGKNQNPKKSLGLQTEPRKMPGPKFNPKIIPCRISEPQKFIYTWELSRIFRLFWIRKKNPFLNQATPKNTCQNFPPHKNRELENVEPQKNPSITPVTWNPEYPPSPLLATPLGRALE